MSILNHKIDFAALLSVTMANPNGDPLDGNRPRTDYEDFGEISDVCIKRKIRNRMMDLGYDVFVQSDDKNKDGYASLSDRALKSPPKTKDKDAYAKAACEKWLDVRSFGQVFAFKTDNVSVGVRGPVSIHQAVSAAPIEVCSMQITKSVNSETSDKRSSDTMGMKHSVDFAVYKIMGSVNVQLAEKTGFTQEDAEILKEALKTLFENDASSARPDGSMEVCQMYWWQHEEKTPAISSGRIQRAFHIDPVSRPKDFTEYH